jgi:hypothetical protein
MQYKGNVFVAYYVHGYNSIWGGKAITESITMGEAHAVIQSCRDEYKFGLYVIYSEDSGENLHEEWVEYPDNLNTPELIAHRLKLAAENP